MREELGPPCGIPQTILQIITRPNREREEAGVVFSPSSIQACHRQPTLTKDHDYWTDVKAGYKPTRGTIFHAGLANEPPPGGVLGVVRELRMQAPVDTIYGERQFWGMPDEVTLLRVATELRLAGEAGKGTTITRLYVKITDFKTRTEVGHDLVRADERHIQQINMYAWLVARFLPGWIKSRGACCAGIYGDNGEMELNQGVLDVDEVIVDELSIVYLDMSRPRTFTSKGFLYDEGKLKGDMVDGKWRRRKPEEHEELELEPLKQYSSEDVEGMIREGIEGKIEAEMMLAPPLTKLEDVRLMCRSCPVRPDCILTGKKEGYDMTLQEAIG